MSVREEDRQRNCPSRGLGIAAAAIGVGVGAALYYFFNKRSEAPDASGSTTNWEYEDAQALHDHSHSSTSESDLDYEETDSDTESDDDSEESHISISDSSNSDTSVDNSYITITEYTTTDTSINSSEDYDLNSSQNTSDRDFSQSSDWENVMSDIPEGRSPEPLLDLFRNLYGRVVSPRKTNAEVQRMAKIREQAFRERSWTLEECSICFENMHRNQEVMALPCSHRFHQPCILPWLEQRQTCPNCRKQA